VDFQTVVVGGGVVGLACADACLRNGGDVLLVERHARLGQETSSRNSEVAHGGLYYPPGTLKARLCVEGRQLMRAFCAEAGVPYLPIGKLIVACDDAEVPPLQALATRAKTNGVEGIHLITAAEAKSMEPELACVAALHSPVTSVVDGTGFMLALEARYVDGGGTVATGTTVIGIERLTQGFRVTCISHGCEATITTRSLVLSGGLSASALARLVTPPLAAPIPETVYAKGHYFALQGPSPFSRLIYPMPSSAGLGVHFTRTTSGEAKFGPDVEWCAEPDTTFDNDGNARCRSFAAAIARYWPEVEEDRLIPAYAGVRPKIAREGEPPMDFAIQGPETHGCEGLIALYGIESPGLTSSLAIGRWVAGRLSSRVQSALMEDHERA
jgi:L-2-hydroxyglutarate oxidase LhgO